MRGPRQGMVEVVTFGEIMLRLNPPAPQRFVQADSLEVSYGGAEASVATSLVNYGVPAAFVTCLPSNELGQAAVNYLSRFGVDTSHIIRMGERIGVYYSEIGANQRASKVIYDRAHSAVSGIKTRNRTLERNILWSKMVPFHRHHTCHIAKRSGCLPRGRQICETKKG